MKTRVIRFVAAVLLTAPGCSPSFPCDPCEICSKCSADPFRPSGRCNDPVANPDGRTPKCTAEARALESCTALKQVCGRDNKTDGAKTLAACQTEYDAYTRCLQAP